MKEAKGVDGTMDTRKRNISTVFKIHFSIEMTSCKVRMLDEVSKLKIVSGSGVLCYDLSILVETSRTSLSSSKFIRHFYLHFAYIRRHTAGSMSEKAEDKGGLIIFVEGGRLWRFLGGP